VARKPPFEGWLRGHRGAIADLEGVRYPKRSKLYKDSGFQDYEPKVEATFQPKKPRGVS